MCQNKVKKAKTGPLLLRALAARSLQNANRLALQYSEEQRRALQRREMLQLALKTLTLMENNRVIQSKIAALHKDTTAFLVSLYTPPELKQRHLEFLASQNVDLLTQRMKLLNAMNVEPKEEPTK